MSPLASLVERSLPSCPTRLSSDLSFRPVSPDSETRIGTAATPGVDRSCHVHPPRYLDKAPGTTIALIRPKSPCSCRQLQNIRPSSDVANPLSRGRNSRADGDGWSVGTRNGSTV